MRASTTSLIFAMTSALRLGSALATAARLAARTLPAAASNSSLMSAFSLPERKRVRAANSLSFSRAATTSGSRNDLSAATRNLAMSSWLTPSTSASRTERSGWAGRLGSAPWGVGLVSVFLASSPSGKGLAGVAAALASLAAASFRRARALSSKASMTLSIVSLERVGSTLA